MTPTMSFDETLRTRRAIRSFLDRTVPDEVLRGVLDDAQSTPSNSNTQPWIAHVVTGTAREKLSGDLIRAHDEARLTLDFPFDGKVYDGAYGQRMRDQAKARFEALGVARDDIEGRNAVTRRNLEFYGAPHVILLFMPAFGGARVAADVGMYAQTLLLALAARGIGSIAQTTLGFYADTVRESLGISDDQKLLFGISLGYADKDWANQNPRIGRAPIEESVTFHG
ncbi:nitroreductase [Streptacidiphilus rugosus]|uniref:nitroreductase n=1 Tax=Streptacidiphilus rugosus TaxID=405783 RepID=UPI001E4AAB30|nr:nitroreductase [Streptacidiphilus rugosus]